MATLDVHNMALYRLGCEPISAVAEDSARALALVAFSENIRKRLFQEYLWPFAIKSAALDENGDTPIFNWDYAYDLPADYLGPVSEENDETIHIESGVLYSNVAELGLKYIWDNDDPDLYSELFNNVWALELAWAASYKLCQDKTLKDQLKDDLKDAKYKAA